MKGRERRWRWDALGVVSLLSISAFVAILVQVAAHDEGARQPLGVVIAGLVAGGLILFRQIRKAANGLITREARAHYAATHDEATQLPNKVLFLERLAKAAEGAGAAQSNGTAVLCIGIDRFEEANEVLGLAGGDSVVIEVAGRLTSVCRERDTVARLGDDLFAMVWSGATHARAHAMSAEMIKLLAAPYEAAAGQAFITCSIGVSFVAADLDDPLESFRQAQLALSNAKRLGGARFSHFDPAMDQSLKHRKALEVDLRRAITEHALNMVYQPQVNAKGAIVGVEALMRWSDYHRGQVSPSAFVPLAESCGLSDGLGRFALRQSLLDAKKWGQLKVAINVSAAQIRSGRLVEMLKDLLAETGANPRNVELEITEGVLLADEPEVFETLNAVKNLGFSLTLDDFGTGYSSLSYLRHFPVEKIKIDRSFVSHLGKRPESSAIIKAIVDLADALGLKVLAEGVETRNQVDRLITAGCHHFQGYYYSEPVDAQAIEEMLAGGLKLAA